MNGAHAARMDTVLVKTFLEMAATGSFVAASDRLYVTQSAISLHPAAGAGTWQTGRPTFQGRGGS